MSAAAARASTYRHRVPPGRRDGRDGRLHPRPIPLPQQERREMIDFSQNYFALFGLLPRYRFDPEKLDAAYRALQRAVHPDRYAAGDDAERRLALQSSARVNEAYRAL